MGWNPVKDAKKWFNRIKDAGESAINRVKSEAQNKVKWIEHTAEEGVNQVENKAKKSAGWIEKKAQDGVHQVEDAAQTAAHELEETFEERIPELITEKLPEALEALAKEASKGAIQKALNTALDTVEVCAPSTLTLVLGMELALVVQGEVTVSVTLPNPVAKLTEIRRWAQDPPNGRNELVACVKDFGPESIAAEAKVSGNGINVEWAGDDKYDRLNAFLAKHGI